MGREHSAFKISVPPYLSTWHNIPEDKSSLRYNEIRIIDTDSQVTGPNMDFITAFPHANNVKFQNVLDAF
jgi:hypothetical protein